jgi:hypothetical protein
MELAEVGLCGMTRSEVVLFSGGDRVGDWLICNQPVTHTIRETTGQYRRPSRHG